MISHGARMANTSIFILMYKHMNLKGIKSKKVSDSIDNLDKVLKVIEGYVDPIDPIEGGSVYYYRR